MNQEKIKQLTKILKKLNSGQITEELKQEAKENNILYPTALEVISEYET